MKHISGVCLGQRDRSTQRSIFRRIGVLWPVIASMLVVPCAHSDWELVVDFEAFEEGVYQDPAAPIAQLVNVTRDEGFEGGLNEGFAEHVIADNRAGGKMYRLGTGGFGSSQGHVFAAIDLAEEIRGKATVYMQVAMAGISNEINFSLTPSVPVPVEPPGESNPWGWEGPDNRSDQATTIRNHSGAIGVGMGPAYRPTYFGWASGDWYEFWIVVDVPLEVYYVYVRGGGDQFASQSRLEYVTDADIFAWNLYFNFSTDVLRALMIGQSAGAPELPFRGDPWWINVIAVDFESENLSVPEGFENFPPPVVEAPLDAWEICHARFFGCLRLDSAPWVYSYNLETWGFIYSLAKGEGQIDLRALPSLSAEWIFLVNSGDRDHASTPESDFIDSEGYLGWIHIGHAPWVYSYDLETWMYLSGGDWSTNSVWVYLLNSHL